NAVRRHRASGRGLRRRARESRRNRGSEKVSVPAGQPAGRALRLHRELAAIWATGPGMQRLASVNHTVIGLRTMITAFVFFVIAGLLGMLTRVQLATPNSAFM